MRNSLNAELERLLALKAVNPNIRDEEVTAIETQIAQLEEYISNAQIQLDSLRVIVVSHN
ncbi:RNA polymerase associated protein RapA [Vibrio ishigakensis]|nr:RNA polymerase associated protein RapA [Vibrio ishigakensis]GAM67604.1 RNA polymerase associated protein rapA [Vibrio sp. JCM 19236]